MTATPESSVSVRDLRNRGGDVLARVARGERLTVTSDGSPVAELRPLPRPSLSPTELVARFKALPAMDEASLKADLDALIDPRL